MQTILLRDDSIKTKSALKIICQSFGLIISTLIKQKPDENYSDHTLSEALVFIFLPIAIFGDLFRTHQSYLT